MKLFRMAKIGNSFLEALFQEINVFSGTMVNELTSDYEINAGEVVRK